MALLLMCANRIVETNAIVDELWGDTPPKSAVATLQSYVYQLRKTFKGPLGSKGVDELIMTQPPGYSLRLLGHELDSLTFTRLSEEGGQLLESGQQGQASVKLRQALSLWRGPVLADLAPGRLLEAHAAYLEETRIRTLELRIRADLQLGRHRELIPELRSLTTTHPLNEWFHVELITALHNTGRRGEALHAYRNLHRILDEELGLMPSASLRELHHQVLTGESLTAIA
ncbi:BTAD domain-containing putative transcriptional regulator [Amycolatopsis sp. NPDC059090]|uniref:AfsR/SARP family transcriptional regulator n=1 Tax=unclassified Amycolatopsis TaxID=2618356 RepID=UPI003671E36C